MFLSVLLRRRRHRRPRWTCASSHSPFRSHPIHLVSILPRLTPRSASPCPALPCPAPRRLALSSPLPRLCQPKGLLAPAPALPFAAAAAAAAAQSTQDLGHPLLPPSLLCLLHPSSSRRLPPSSSFSSFTHSLSLLPKFDRQTEVPGEPRGGRKNKKESTGKETRTTFMTLSLSLSSNAHKA